MPLRWLSKGGVIRALAGFPLLAYVTALLLCSGMPVGAVVLGTANTAAVPAMDDGRFSGVGRIECRDREKRGTIYVATGWLAGSADTVVTAAHTLFRGSARDAAPKRFLNPSDCTFILHDRNQTVREKVKIRYALSPWMKKRFRGDSSYDVAVLKLEHAVKVDYIPEVKISASTEKRSIDLIAIHTGVHETQSARITRGQQHAFPASQLRYDASALRITNPMRLFSASADSAPGSSGGMYYDEKLRAAVGLHIGALCDQINPRYDPDACFNYGLRFDRAIVALVEAVVRDQPQNGELLMPDENVARLALAPATGPRG